MAATARPVDLTNVKEGGVFRPRRKPEGDYKAKIVKADDHTPKKAGSVPGWVLTIQIDGDARSTYPYYLSPEENQAWKVRGICLAAGLNVKSARIRFDPNKLVNKTIGVALGDDEFEGKLKSMIEDVMPVSEIGPNADEDAPEPDYDDADEVPEDEVEVPDDEEEEEEEAPAPPPVRKRRAKPAPDPEPEDEDEEDEEPPAPKRRTARSRVVEPDPEPEDDEDEPEPEPAPRRRRAVPPAKKAAPARKRAAAPPVDEDDDDLDDLDTDDLD